MSISLISNLIFELPFQNNFKLYHNAKIYYNKQPNFHNFKLKHNDLNHIFQSLILKPNYKNLKIFKNYQFNHKFNLIKYKYFLF